MMWGGYDAWGGGWWGAHMLFSAFFWILIIAAIVVGVRWMASPPGRSESAPPTENALDILRKRYARGEIDREEFEQKKRDLEA